MNKDHVALTRYSPGRILLDLIGSYKSRLCENANGCLTF